MSTLTRPSLRLTAGAAALAVAAAGLAGCSSSCLAVRRVRARAPPPAPRAVRRRPSAAPSRYWPPPRCRTPSPRSPRPSRPQHPGVTVKFSFGGSDTLAAQITQGAPADVFASANQSTMQTVQKAGDTTGTPTVFVRNTLEIAVPPGNPKGIKTLADLVKPGVKVAECAATVPCGSAAVKALAAAKVKLTPVTYETDVTSALTKVELGEVDAALVYHSDIVGASGKVDGVVFSTAAVAVNSYPIDVLKDAPNPSAAQAFVAFVLSASSEQALLKAGFQAP